MLNVEETDSPRISSSASIMCTRTRGYRAGSRFSVSISRETKAIARSSRISEALKLISLMRLRMPAAVVGASSRVRGFT